MSVAMMKYPDNKQFRGRVSLAYNSKLWFIVLEKSRQGFKQLVTSHP